MNSKVITVHSPDPSAIGSLATSRRFPRLASVGTVISRNRVQNSKHIFSFYASPYQGSTFPSEYYHFTIIKQRYLIRRAFPPRRYKKILTQKVRHTAEKNDGNLCPYPHVARLDPMMLHACRNTHYHTK